MTDGGYTKTEAWNLQLQARIEETEAHATQAEAEGRKEGVIG